MSERTDEDIKASNDGILKTVNEYCGLSYIPYEQVSYKTLEEAQKALGCDEAEDEAEDIKNNSCRDCGIYLIYGGLCFDCHNKLTKEL